MLLFINFDIYKTKLVFYDEYTSIVIEVIRAQNQINSHLQNELQNTVLNNPFERKTVGNFVASLTHS